LPAIISICGNGFRDRNFCAALWNRCKRAWDLVNSRHKAALLQGLDVAREETLLNATRTQATLLLQQRKQFEDAIAVLAGRAAPDFHVALRELKK